MGIGIECEWPGHEIDPLTCDKWILPGRMDLCDCPASEHEGMEHSESCGWSPIYADTVPSDFQMVIGSFHAARATMVQTVIKCALCGREMLGRDALVVRDQAQVGVPGNIVKAVCPSHNRLCTQPAYQRQAWAGY